MVRISAVIALVGALTAGAAGRAFAQGSRDYFTEQKKTRLTYKVEGERSSTQLIVLGSLAGATVLTGGIGLYFNLASRDAADEVRALSGDHTGRVYTHDVDQRRQDAELYGTVATVFYAVGGALLVSTVVTFIATSPPDEVREYHSGTDSLVGDRGVSLPYVAPVEGGAMIGKVWTF